jgi:hypothetical protein
MSREASLQQYIEVQLKLLNGVKADIAMRWMMRIEGEGLHTLGRAGARVYLAKYGKNISERKLIGLAYKAEAEGFPEMAEVFWEKAYEIHVAEQAKSVHHISQTQQNRFSSNQEYLVHIRNVIYDSFNKGEIKSLCYDLGIEDEDIPSTTRNEMVIELIRYTVRHGRFKALIDRCKELRPHQEWVQ